MDSYKPLKDYLLSSGRSRIVLTFPELERVLGFPLPRSARAYPAWWANGGHSQANAWLGAGYRAEQVSLSSETVVFRAAEAPARKAEPARRAPEAPLPESGAARDAPAGVLCVCGHSFRYLQQLLPECGADGRALKFYPQGDCPSHGRLPLNQYGDGAFCRFRIDAGRWPGVYLWVAGGKILYVGETEDLQRRFNLGYGVISPRNCFAGGQSTNCRMNKVVLSQFEAGRIVSLYFLRTEEHKRVELELLRGVTTPYNIKDNR